jgi:hypothetical protein
MTIVFCNSVQIGTGGVCPTSLGFMKRSVDGSEHANGHQRLRDALARS